MAIGNYFGRAKADARAPSAAGECDRCGTWYQLDTLALQFQWQGSSLAATGYYVCPRCLDVPFEQNKVLILPADPKPRINPRPGTNITGQAILGFTPPPSPDYLGMTRFQLSIADSIAGMYPTAKADVLSGVANLTGIPTPATITDQSISITAGQPQTLLVPNINRIWMLLYNPTQMLAEFTLGATVANGTMNLAIGPGDAYFWAAAQNLQPVFTGIVQALGQYSGLPLWAWDSSSGSFGNDGGLMTVTGVPTGWQIGPAGLPAGAVYLVQNNPTSTTFLIGVVPGVTPNPNAAPVLFGSISSAAFLTLGGGNLPLSTTGASLVSNQLFNNGGLVCVAS